MKEKMKPMMIGGGIGAVAGLGSSYLMGKKDTKNMIMFAVIGLAVGAAVGYFFGGKKDEQKSSFKGDSFGYGAGESAGKIRSGSGGTRKGMYRCYDDVTKNWFESATPCADLNKQQS